MSRKEQTKMRNIIKRSAALLLSLLLCFGLAGQCLAAESDTYYIYNADDLFRLRQKCTLDSWSEGKTVILMSDLFLGDESFAPIPSFSGSFDGHDHTINGLNICTKGVPSGLFAVITEQGSVQNLSVSGSVVPDGSASQVGGIAGVNYGMIQSCSFSGTITAKSLAGGIAGENAATGIIKDCSTSGSLFSKSMTGGIAGKNSGVLRSCSSTMYVNTNKVDPSFSVEDFELDSYSDLVNLSDPETYNISTDTGGIAGFSDGYILSCTGAGVVGYQHIGYNVGGVAGRSSGHMSDCRNTGTVYGRKDVGGIVGMAEPSVTLDVKQDSINNIRVQLHTLSSLITKAADDVGTSSHTISARLTAIGDNVDDVTDGVKDLGDVTTDYIDSTVSEVNRFSEIVDSSISQLKDVTALLPAISDELSAALESTDAAIAELQTAGSYSSAALTNLQRSSDELQKAINLLSDGMKEIDTGVQQISGSVTETSIDMDAISQGLEKVSNGLHVIVDGNTASGGVGINAHLSSASTYLRYALDDLTTAAYYVDSSMPYVRDAISSLDSASNTLTEALKNLDSLISYLDNVDPIKFETISDKTTESSDSIYTAVKNISAELETLNTEMTNASDTLVQDIKNINSQFLVVSDLLLDELYGLENYSSEDYISDTSDEDIDAVMNGKVFRCTNSGIVYGDIDVGGIAGSMEIYNSLDPERDFSNGTSILNRRYELKCIIQDCISSGKVAARKNNAGAICGLSELGIITDCEGSGSVSSENGGYVGGIAGSCGNIIRQCSAKTTLSGGSHIGGIAGGNANDSDSASVSSCYSMAEINSDGEYLGAVAGDLFGSFSDNYFVSDSLAGINGLSYSGQAEPLTYEELLKREDVPALFHSFILSFVDDDTTIRTVSFKYGDSFDDTVFPQLSSKDGCYAKWDETTLKNLHFDKTVTAEYLKHITALPSTAERSNDRPVFFVEGSFDDNSSLSADTIITDFSAETLSTIQLIQSYNREILEQWHLEFTDDGSETHTVRYLIPSAETDLGNRIFLYLRTSDGWEKLDYTTIGSYLCFDLSDASADITVISSVTAWWFWVLLSILVLGVILLILITLLVTGHKIRKAKASNSPELKEVKRKAGKARRIIVIPLILLLLIIAGSIAAIIRFAPQVKNDAELYLHLRNYIQNTESSSRLTVTDDGKTFGADLYSTECDGKKVHIISWQGIPVYFCENAMILENGDAYSLDNTIPDEFELISLAATAFRSLEITAQETTDSNVYTASASGETAKSILSLLSPYADFTDNETVQVSMITRHGEISSLMFSCSGSNSISAEITMLKNTPPELPEDVIRAISDGTAAKAGPIPEETKTMLLSWLRLAEKDPVQIDARIKAEYKPYSVNKSLQLIRTEIGGKEVFKITQGNMELYASGNTICDKKGNSVSSGVSASAEMAELLSNCYRVCLDASSTLQTTSDNQVIYTLTLEASEMERLTSILSPGFDTKAAEFTGGELVITSDNGIISHISISCKGTISILSLTNSVSIGAELAIDEAEKSIIIPDSVMSALSLN